MRVVTLAAVLAVVLSVDAKKSSGTQENVCHNQEDGTFVADSDSCSSFIVCYGGKPVSQNCESGSYFDTKQLYCMPDAKNVCSPSECKENGTYSAHPTNCSLFHICNAGKLVEQSCGQGSYFDSSNLFCKPDVDHICWPATPSPEPCTCVGNYTQGDLVKDPDSCHSYYVCNNGDLVQETCGFGNYFDSSTNRCERDITEQCWPQAHPPCAGGLAEGDRVSSSTNCSVYLECTHGELVEQNCAYQYLFDNATKQCVRDEAGKCWEICTCPGGYNQGDLVGSSANCSSYFYCDGGKLIPRDCGFGNYFDNSTNNCVSDKNGACWKPDDSCTCAGGYKEGEFVESEDNCYSYSICYRGELVPQSCGTGNYFDKNKKICERDYEGKCWPKCKEGDKVADKTSCHGYFVCTKGELVANSCGVGNYFDNESKNCVHDDENICWPRLCPGGLLDGDRIPIAENCSMYYECSKGDLLPQNCLHGFYFDVLTKQCMRDEDGKCWEICNCPGGSNQGDLVGNSANCSSYFICNGGKLIPGDCGFGNYFDNESKNCVHDEENVCWPRLCPGGLLDGDRVPIAENCSMYYECSKGDLLPQNCLHGFYFDVSTKQCMRDEDGKCWEICDCPGGSNQGDLVGNSANCSSYFICNGGKLIPGDCGFGNYFDNESKNCVHDEENVCWPRLCPGGLLDGDRVPIAENCSMYYECSKGDLLPQNCLHGFYFDVSTKQCMRDEDGKCWEICDCPGGSNQGDLVGNSANCSSYFICNGGKLIPGDCGFGNYFDNESKNCVHDEENVCWPRLCPGGLLDGDRVPIAENCSMYYECSKGELLPQNCLHGFYFDVPTKQCMRDEDGKCWEICDCPGGYNQGDLVADSANCSSYFFCDGGKLIPRDCGFGNYFDTKTNSCIRDINGVCWKNDKPCECPGGYEDGQFVKHNTTCYMFYICYGGKLIEESCGYGNYFDSIIGSCALDVDGICWKKDTSSSSSTKSTSTSSSTTTTTTSKPTKTTTTSTTSTTTEAPCTCEGGYVDGDFIPHNKSCYMFYICNGGKLIEESCGYGNYFDILTGSCALDVDGICWKKDTSSSSSTKSTSTSSSTTTTTTLKPTRTTTTSTTSTTTEAPCTCEGGYEDGQFVPHPRKCYLFYMCYNGKLVEQSCGYGNYFDAVSQNCILDTNGICWSKTTSSSTTKRPTSKPTTTTTRSTTTPSTTTPSGECPGGYQNGDLIPHPSTCYKFYVCYNGSIVEKFCQRGEYFDAQTKTCVLDSNGICWPLKTTSSSTSTTTTTPSTTKSTTTTSTKKPSTTTKSTTTTSTTTPSTTTTESCECPGGYKDGELVPHSSNCFKFYICFNGELVEESCGKGNYFDALSNSCVLDTAGICWPLKTTSSSTSTTTTPSTTTPSTTKSTTTTQSTTTTSTKKPSTTTKSTTTTSTTTPSTTTTESCECPGGYKDGELVPHPSNCFKFYICFNGKLVEESCGKGNYFDALSKSCVLDTAGICWPLKTTSSSTSTTTTPSTTTPSTTTTSTKKPSTTTKSTTTTSTTTPSTTTTESCECPGGYKDGELVSHPTNCFKFYICFNGNLVEESCGNGNYFDALSKSCVLDTAGICWPLKTTSSSTSTTTTPSTTTSSTTKSTTTTSTKKPSTTTKSTTKTSTTTPSTTTTESCECPGGYKDGELVPHPSNCFKFYICFNGKLVEESCGKGNYFDALSKSCVLDTAGICWPLKTTSSSTSTTTTPSTTTPSTTKSTTTTQSTTTTSTKKPSTTTKSTTTTSTTTPSTTTTESCECPGGYKDGELVSHPTNCFKFYICFNGKLVEESCGKGNYFEGSSKSCILDTAGICWPLQTTPSTSSSTSTTTSSSTTTPSTSTSTTTPSTTTTTTSTTPCILCPGGHEEGDFVPNPKNCSKFFICHQGKLSEMSCGKGNYFNEHTKSCTLDINGICWPKTTTTTQKPEPCKCPNGLEEGQFTADPDSCFKYSICHNGWLVGGNCGTGNFFNNDTKVCQSDTTGVCWPIVTTPSTTTPCECPYGLKEGERIDKADSCYMYFTCSEGNLIEGNCGTGNYFNNDTKTCDRDANNCCWPCTNGEMIANIEECDKFSICNDGKFVEQQCGTGYYFDVYEKYCVRDVNGTCWKVQAPSNACQGAKDGTLLPNPAACEKYFECQNNKPVAQECGMGNLFNSTTLSCVHDTCGECWTKIPNVCANKPTGTFMSSTEHCDQFIVCHENHAILQQCGSGNWFNPKSLLCEQDLYAKCINVCQNTEGTTQLPHPNCNEFYLCQNGLTKAVRTCLKGTNYDAIRGICLASATCEENLCSTSPNGVSYPVRNDPSSFYSCYNKKPVKLSCPSGTSFDSERLICMPDIGLCIGQKNGFTIASKKNANAYYVCKDNAAIFEQCPPHTVFDDNKRICVHALRKRVVNNICSTEADGTMILSNSCNKFHLCLDGESIEQNCGAYASFNPKLGSCVFNATCFNSKEICGKSSDIEKFPDARDESSYVACKRGVATIEKCPKNTIYSHDIGSCVTSQMAIKNKELSKMCSKVPDRTIAPALDCRKFYICSNRVATLQQCAIDQLFNMTTGTCQADTARQCWMRSETLRKSNFLRMIDDNDDYKIVCEECKKRLKRYEPKSKNSFKNLNIGLLRRQRETGCSPEYASLVRRSEKSCTKFYYCEDDEWKLKNCPLGKFFNSQLETCTYDSSFCEIQSTENSSCISNAVKPNEKNCESYYVCFEGKWRYRHCKEGTYFNRTHEKCVNADGLCQSTSKLQNLCKNGTIAEISLNSCSAYYLCVDGNWLIRNCPIEHYFNETLKACMQDDNGSCSDETEQKYLKSGRKFNPTNCTAFEIFVNNEWLSVHCPAGFYFDVFLNKCLVNGGECSNNGLIRQNCIDQTLKPSFNNFSDFYQCSNNEWHQESCMPNFRFDATIHKCVVSNNTNDLMNFSQCKNIKYANLASGIYYSHETDCNKFYFCEHGIRIQGVCNEERYFDSKTQRCQYDNKVCHNKQVTHSSICQNKSNGTFHRNPSNCTTFYKCINMSAQLTHCPQGEYFDAELDICQTDIGKCMVKHNCNNSNTRQFPHEIYCSIYYTCIGGKFIAIACEEHYFFDPVLNKCVPDNNHLCIDGVFNDSNSTDDVTAVTSTIHDSISCTGRQGDIMPDPKNCNKFYVCINEQLQHDKCFDGEFFDITKNICTLKTSNGTCENSPETTMKCSNSDREINYADNTDCRKYYQCNDAEIISKKCRNGESFDNLLGFCRQNDGTCLIENGHRVGACAGKHGKLVADADNCLQYYTCINGQKISKSCKLGEYFDTSASMCQKDLNKTCLVLETEVKNETELMETQETLRCCCQEKKQIIYEDEKKSGR